MNPYIMSRDATKHLEWLKTVFDAEVEAIHYVKDSKKIMHTCISLCDGKVMMSDFCEGKTESFTGDRGIAICLNYENGDGEKYWKRGMANGAKPIEEFGMQFWGALFGSFLDPFGFEWMLHEEVKGEEEKGQENGDKAKTENGN